jgi:hypothetical protein
MKKAKEHSLPRPVKAVNRLLATVNSDSIRSNDSTVSRLFFLQSTLILYNFLAIFTSQDYGSNFPAGADFPSLLAVNWLLFSEAMLAYALSLEKLA